MRFDHHAPGVGAGIMYAGIRYDQPVDQRCPEWELAAVTAEVMYKIVGKAHVDDILRRKLATFTNSEPLKLVNLTGSVLTQLDLDSLITSTPCREITQAWARWFHKELSAEGLYWRSARQTRFEVICVNERAAAKLHFIKVEDCNDRAVLARVLKAHKFAGGKVSDDVLDYLRALGN
jgi:hypothetical protein